MGIRNRICRMETGLLLLMGKRGMPFVPGLKFAAQPERVTGYQCEEE
jgi:hypothetical protein